MKFLGDELRALLEEFACRSCGAKGARAEVLTEGPHFGKAVCASCGRFGDWIAFPISDQEDKRDRKRSRRYVTRLGEQRCEICLRHKDQLPEPQKIEVQHVIEKCAGGEDEPENFRLYCTSCHSLVNWVRTYFGHYHMGDAE